MTVDLKNKSVLVTGGSSGIGEEAVYLFAKAGARVALTYHSNRADGSRVAEKAWDLGAAEAFPLHLDLLDPDAIQATIDAAVSRLKGIDVLVNNAAIVARGPVGAVTDDDLERVVTTNFTAQVRLIRAALPHLTDCLINVGSGALHRPVPNSGVYSATKAALTRLTEVLAVENPHLRCYTVHPGRTKTAMLPEGMDATIPAGFIYQVASGEHEVPSGGQVNVQALV